MQYSLFKYDENEQRRREEQLEEVERKRGNYGNFPVAVGQNETEKHLEAIIVPLKDKQTFMLYRHSLGLIINVCKY